MSSLFAATGHDVTGTEYSVSIVSAAAAIAQLGERQTEDLKVPGSIPGLGNTLPSGFSLRVCGAACSSGR